MKPTDFCNTTTRLILAFIFTIHAVQQISVGQTTAEEPPQRPSITSIETDGAELVVTVDVPEGIQKVTLESKTRLRVGAWIPRAVERMEGRGGTVTFRLPQSEAHEILRVRADSEEPLPISFYRGESEFGGAEGGDGSAPPTRGGFEDSFDPVASPGEDADGDRDVVESDIWKLDGDRLYFFNQFRGLQVIDIGNADEPQILGTLDLPAAGEQMYLLDPTTVILLAHDGCYGSDGQILIVDVESDMPSIQASLPLSGRIQESRLVGTALYLTTQTCQHETVRINADGREIRQWVCRTLVQSYDLADPTQPLERDEFSVDGYRYDNVVYATSTHLFVATHGVGRSEWWKSDIHVFDISSPDGAMSEIAALQPDGWVKDKFKMNLNGDVFTVISENRNDGIVTRLETFDFSNPTKPERLASIDLADGETLFATRFDGNKVYIVTFLRIDPLWIVDLQDPANPQILGELEVPGWSTYMQPLGDLLLTIGIDNEEVWRVSVSLFDVKDPAEPSLLSRLPMGTHHSWSEATQDEKAFGFDRDAGLILVPFQGYEESGSVAQVQLIELKDRQLIKRGTISHSVQPRRAALHHGNIVSISGKELLMVDAADWDNPALTSETTLSWSVDRVMVVGEFLVEISHANSWTDETTAVRIVDQEATDEIITEIELGDVPVAGADINGDFLYLAQAVGSGEPVIWFDVVAQQEDEPKEPEPNVALTVIDLSDLPNLSVVGQERIHVEDLGWSTQMKPIWPSEDFLVLTSSGDYWGFYRGIEADNLIDAPIWWGGLSGRLIAFDVSDPEAPTHRSTVDLRPDDERNWWNFSEAFAAEGLVYASYQASEFLEGVLAPGREPPKSYWSTDPETGERILVEPPIGTWVQRYYLNVIDYADAGNPTIRKPLNIPGQLVGLSHQGALLYTQGYHWDEETFETDGYQWLDASAYDGVTASLVDSLALTTTWPAPIVDEGTIYLSSPADFNSRPDGQPRKDTNTIQIWKLSIEGEFVMLAESVSLPSSVHFLAAIDDLLVTQAGNNTWLFGRSNPGQLDLLGVGQPSGCTWWGNLNNADGSIDQGLWIPLGDYGVSPLVLGDGERQLTIVRSGTFFGECGWYCVRELSIQGNYARFVATNQGDPPTDYIRSNYLSDAEVGRILDQADLAALEALPDVIGCPDCNDGDGEWVEIERAGVIKRVTFEFGQKLESIQGLLDAVRDIRNRFSVPEPEPPDREPNPDSDPTEGEDPPPDEE